MSEIMDPTSDLLLLSINLILSASIFLIKGLYDEWMRYPVEYFLQWISTVAFDFFLFHSTTTNVS